MPLAALLPALFVGVPVVSNSTSQQKAPPKRGF
jgi:hypothetical protein